MTYSFSYIKFLVFAAILLGFALASVHHHNVTLHSGEIIVENGDPECSMCDGTVKIDNEIITVSKPDLTPTTTDSDEMLLTANLPFKRIIKDRAPPSCASI